MVQGFKRLIVILVALAGVTITLYGIYESFSWPMKLPWLDLSALAHASTVLLFGVFFSIIASCWRAFNALYGGSLIILITALLFNAVWPLFVVAWLACSAAVLGGVVITRLSQSDTSNNLLLNLLTGLGIYGTAAGLLAHWPLNYSGIYAIALALPLALNPQRAFDLLKKVRNVKMPINTELRSTVALQAMVSGFALLYFVVALMPEVGHDALAMHLFVPAHMALRHQWGFDAATYVWAVMPMLGDWIYTITYMLGGENAARIANIGFIFLIAVQVHHLARAIGASRNGALWSVLLFLSTPLTFTEGSSLFIESIWAAYIVGAISLSLQLCFSHDEKKTRLLALGLLIGFALAAKAATIPTMLPTLMLLLLLYRRWMTKKVVSEIFLAAIILLAIGGIPYLTAWQITGNPVFPFFNGIFKSSLYPAINFDATAFFGKGVDWNTAYKVTFESGKYLEATPGAAGFQWLIFLTPALTLAIFRRNLPAIVIFMLAISSLYCVFYSTAYLRYIFPQAAILIACISLVLSPHPEASRTFLTAINITAMLIVGLNFLFLGAGAFYNDFPWRTIINESERTAYLQTRLPMRNAIELINSINIDDANVAIFSPPYSAGLRTDAYYSSWYNSHFASKVTAAKSAAQLGDVFCASNIEFVILNTANRSGRDFSLIMDTTEDLMRFGNISIRKVGNAHFSTEELLKNPNFSSLDGWILIGNAKQTNSGSLLVSSSSPAVQPISIAPGRNYKNSVTARCAEKETEGRIQINWLDSSGKMIKPDISTFTCTKDWSENSAIFHAPCGATTAMVYASPGSTDFLEFRNVSLH
jgi:hypothetical protein